MDKQLIVIIGLPGSGKSTYSRTLSSYKLFDDFFNTFYNGNIIELLRNKEKVCLNDPRLCDMNHFNRYIEIFLKYVPKNDIHLVLFENSPEICYKNIQDRNDNKKGVDVLIKHLSLEYNIENYKEYNHTVLPVYKSIK